ncbi:MAG: signal peptidase [Actinomycetota bacterium]|jgi:signal peptidase I
MNGVPVSDSQNSDNIEEIVDGVDEQQRPESEGQGFLGWLRETSIIVVTALTISVLLRTFVFQAFYVPSQSMLEQLQVNDRIIASKISYKVGDINRGDVLVFQDPGNWLREPDEQIGFRGAVTNFLTWIGVIPANSGKDLVKRVIGIPGDTVECCSPEGFIKINGKAIDESAYVRETTDQLDFKIVVPPGRLFMMGDNRGHSSDSRYHLDVANGTIPIENVVGQVVAVVWPMERFGKLETPSVLSTVPNSK